MRDLDRRERAALDHYLTTDPRDEADAIALAEADRAPVLDDEAAYAAWEARQHAERIPQCPICGDDLNPGTPDAWCVDSSCGFHAPIDVIRDHEDDLGVCKGEAMADSREDWSADYAQGRARLVELLLAKHPLTPEPPERNLMTTTPILFAPGAVS